jgi:hypothetical protein
MAGRLALKVIEIVASVVFLVLCAKSFCTHFYNDQMRALPSRKQRVAFVEDAPSLVPAKVSAKRMNERHRK